MNIKINSLNPGIAEAIAIMGSQLALAERLGICQSRVSAYLRTSLPPVEIAMKLERDRKLKIPRWKSRPDLFGER